MDIPRTIKEMNMQDIPILMRILLVNLTLNPFIQRLHHSEDILTLIIMGNRFLMHTQAIRLTKTPILVNTLVVVVAVVVVVAAAAAAAAVAAAAVAIKEYPLIPDTPGQPRYQTIILKVLLITAYRDISIRLALQAIPKVITSTRLIRQVV